MTVHIQIFLRQMLRGKKRLILNVLLLTVATAFFIMSLNLYQNSRDNLRKVENSYITLGLPAFFGNVDQYGNLVSADDPDYKGYHVLSVTDFDLSQLTDLEQVLRYDLRYRCAAYIPGQIAMTAHSEGNTSYAGNEHGQRYEKQILRFTIVGDEPVFIPFATRDMSHDQIYQQVSLNILDQATKGLVYPTTVELGFSAIWNDTYAATYADEIKRVNRSEDTSGITLYPGVEYIMQCNGLDRNWIWDKATGVYKWSSNSPLNPLYIFTIAKHYLDCDYMVMYYSTGMLGNGKSPETSQPFYIQRYEDVQASTEEASYWNDLWARTNYSANSFCVTLTNDVSMLPAWQMGGMYINEGRAITSEEYASGAKVCIISSEMAQCMGWNIGDKLDLNLYAHGGFYDRTGVSSQIQPQYQLSQTGFMDRGEYEIVGLYGQSDVRVNEGQTAQYFYQPWNAIYAPTKSVSNLPAEDTWPIQPSLVTLQLKNGSIGEFQKAVEKLGLTDQVEGEYTLQTAFIDQGYESVGPGLEKMQSTARLLLAVSAAFLLVVLVLAAYFFAQQHKHSAGILRVLGGSKKQALAGILTCALLLALVSAAIGSLSGGILGQVIGNSILSSGSGELVRDDLISTSNGITVDITVGSDPLLTALGGLTIAALFTLLLAVFVSLYLGKEPRELLPKEQE